MLFGQNGSRRNGFRRSVTDPWKYHARLVDLVSFHSRQVEIHILINYYEFTCCIGNSVDPGSTLLTKVDISSFILFSKLYIV